MRRFDMRGGAAQQAPKPTGVDQAEALTAFIISTLQAEMYIAYLCRTKITYHPAQSPTSAAVLVEPIVRMGSTMEELMRKRLKEKQDAYDAEWDNGRGSHHPDFDPAVRERAHELMCWHRPALPPALAALCTHCAMSCSASESAA